MISAGNLLTIRVDAARRVGDPDTREQFDCGVPCGFLGKVPVGTHHFDHLRPDRSDRVEQRLGIRPDQRDAAAALRVLLCAAPGEDRTAAEPHIVRDHPSAAGQ